MAFQPRHSPSLALISSSQSPISWVKLSSSTAVGRYGAGSIGSSRSLSAYATRATESQCTDVQKKSFGKRSLKKQLISVHDTTIWAAVGASDQGSPIPHNQSITRAHTHFIPLRHVQKAQWRAPRGFGFGFGFGFGERTRRSERARIGLPVYFPV